MEQQALNDVLSEANSWTAPYDGANVVFRRLKVPNWNCPSSPCPIFGLSGSEQCWSGGDPQLADYVGIAGTVTTSPDTTGRNSSSNYDGGIYSASGILSPAINIKLADILDGTSNTLMVGENSNYTKVGGGGAHRPPLQLLRHSGAASLIDQPLGWGAGYLGHRYDHHPVRSQHPGYAGRHRAYLGSQPALAFRPPPGAVYVLLGGASSGARSPTPSTTACS